MSRGAGAGAGAAGGVDVGVDCFAFGAGRGAGGSGGQTFSQSGAPGVGRELFDVDVFHLHEGDATGMNLQADVLAVFGRYRRRPRCSRARRRR